MPTAISTETDVSYVPWGTGPALRSLSKNLKEPRPWRREQEAEPKRFFILICPLPQSSVGLSNLTGSAKTL